MDLLLVMTYTAICIGIFKLFKIPLTKWTVPTALLGGVILVGGLIFVMNYNHPYSEATREYFLTTPITPSVNGRVVEVTGETNTPLTQGDVLFRLDPTPFNNKIRGLRAQLRAAEQDLARTKTLVKTGAVSGRNVDIAQASVDNLKAQMEDAKFNLEQTIVRAPTDGYVTQVLLRPGMYATAMPMRPVMVFIHKDQNIFVGWFRQESMMRLNTGYDAEIALDGIPGEVFSAVVVKSLPALAEGQLQASGNLLNAAQAAAMGAGRIPVMMKITDPRFDAYRKDVPFGVYGQSAIYSDHMHHVAVMRKILLRMSSWMNYIFPFH